MRRTSGAAVLGAVLATVTAVAGCGGSSTTTRATGSSRSGSALGGTVTVFAAASLTEAFTTVGAQFRQSHPGVKVVFNFGPSSGLARQITHGAPADVFASASTKDMEQVVSAGAAANPRPLVTNVMEIAIAPSNPGRVASIRDLAKPSVKVALCQRQVPCGAVAAKVLDNVKVRVTPVTQEVDVKSVLAKVELGEVDAGLVYVTDVRAAGAKVTGVRIPAGVNASTTYPIAPLASARNKAGAQAFVAFVSSPAGVAVLTAHGFRKP